MCSLSTPLPPSLPPSFLPPPPFRSLFFSPPAFSSCHPPHALYSVLAVSCPAPPNCHHLSLDLGSRIYFFGLIRGIKKRTKSSSSYPPNPILRFPSIIRPGPPTWNTFPNKNSLTLSLPPSLSFQSPLFHSRSLRLSCHPADAPQRTSKLNVGLFACFLPSAALQ